MDVPVLGVVSNWAIQLQGIDAVSSPATFAHREVDMLVIEPMRSQRGAGDFPMRDLVQRAQRSPGATLPQKRVLAYLNVGQAEDYRGYWQPDWQPPAAADSGATDGRAAGMRPGDPAFLLATDPDGWHGNYPVAYWRPEWRACLFGHEGAPLDQILTDGFDGIYCDWVLGFLDPHVEAAARRDGVDPAVEMVRLLRDLRSYARERYPLFLVVAQNGLPLAERRPELLTTIDALAQEDLSFRGTANVPWHDPGAGDVPAPASGDWSTKTLGRRLQAMRARGMPVFTLDYCLEPKNAERATAAARSFGCVPFVSRTPLDRLPFPAAPAGH